MNVVVNEFEVVPANDAEPAPPPSPAAAAPSPPSASAMEPILSHLTQRALRALAD